MKLQIIWTSLIWLSYMYASFRGFFFKKRELELRIYYTSKSDIYWTFFTNVMNLQANCTRVIGTDLGCTRFLDTSNLQTSWNSNEFKTGSFLLLVLDWLFIIKKSLWSLTKYISLYRIRLHTLLSQKYLKKTKPITARFTRKKYLTRPSTVRVHTLLRSISFALWRFTFACLMQ